jgi:hypothetical protein
MSARNFLAGRNLAVDLLREARALDADEKEWSIAPEGRANGKVQDNYALRYIDQLIQHPELREGFAAVLSDCLGPAPFDPPELYRRYTYAQMTGPGTSA